ncbi:hypothetical protein VCV18_002661 [Metarhizium anisopliae]
MAISPGQPTRQTEELAQDHLVSENSTLESLGSWCAMVNTAKRRYPISTHHNGGYKSLAEANY